MMSRTVFSRFGHIPAGHRWRVCLFLSQVLLFLTLLVLLTGPHMLHAENYMSRTMVMQVMVADPEVTADRMVEWIEGRGGYYIYKSPDLIIIRISMENLEGLRLFTEGEAEQVVSVAFEAQDLRGSIITLQSGIVSGEEILERNLRYLRNADVEGTLAIEREVTRLLKEIEDLKGRLRRLENDIRFARAEIYLSFMEQTLPQTIPSSFAWINSIDFYGFVEGGYVP